MNRSCSIGASRLFFQLFLIFQNGSFVIGCGFSFYEGDGVCGTGREAVSQTVAVVFTEQLRFSAYDSDCAFVAGPGTEPAAITFLFIYMNDFSDYEIVLPDII